MLRNLSSKSMSILLSFILIVTLLPLSPIYAASKLSISSVTASSHDGNVPTNTIDGNLSTRWSAQGDGESIKYDLGAIYNVEYIRLAWHQGNTRTSNFTIQLSTNNSSWSTVYNGSSSGTSTSLETYNFPDTDARYIRIIGHGNSYNNWNSITETEIWGSNTSSPPSGSGLTINSASASTYDDRCDCNAPRAIDGDLDTRWSGQGNGAWIKFDLGTSQTVGSIKIAFHQGNQRTSSFAIQTSTNNSSWTTVYNGTSSGSTLQLETFNFADITARYIRYVGYGNSVNDWNSLSEVEIHGADGSGGSGDGGTGGLDPTKPPSDNFDLTKWKITLPDASEIQPAALNNGYEHPNWFYTDPVTGGMVFRSPNLGGTTQNSSYTRSELREMLNPSAGTKSLGNNWVTSTSSSSTKSQAGGVDGTMNATLRVDHVSTTGESGKVGRVVVGQIHGPDTEPIRLYYHKRPSDSKGAIYFGTDNLENKTTWVNIIGGPNSLNPSNGIELGQKWSYEIKVVGLQMTVKVTPEGGSTTTVTYTLPSGYNNKYLYFKAGVYNQNNTGTTSDYTQATFFNLTHTHP